MIVRLGVSAKALSRQAAALATALSLVGVSGCGANRAGGPVADPVSGSASAAPCTPAAPGTEKLHGPVEWEHQNTQLYGNTWSASQGAWDHGLIEVESSRPVIFDSVTIDEPDAKTFAPVRLLGAWVAPPYSVGSLQMVPAGKWPGRLVPAHCYHMQAAERARTFPILVIRLEPVIGAAAKGRKWAADTAVVLHYQTLDGQHYQAPFAYLNVWPTAPGNDTGKGGDLLLGARQSDKMGT